MIRPSLALSIASISCQKKTPNDRLESALVPTDRRTSQASKRSEWKHKVSNEDQARLIAERVARRLAADSAGGGRVEPAPPNGESSGIEPRRARIINFVSSSAPPRTQPSVGRQTETTEAMETRLDIFESRAMAPQVAQSPWLAPFAASLGVPPASGQTAQSAIRNSQFPEHPSAERFGIEEAAVSELVEFFEAEKQCSVDPSGKPCDHCAMCSSRGF